MKVRRAAIKSKNGIEMATKARRRRSIASSLSRIAGGNRCAGGMKARRLSAESVKRGASKASASGSWRKSRRAAKNRRAAKTVRRRQKNIGDENEGGMAAAAAMSSAAGRRRCGDNGSNGKRNGGKLEKANGEMAKTKAAAGGKRQRMGAAKNGHQKLAGEEMAS